MEKVNDYKDYRFQAVLQLIGINPYVEIPPPILLAICNDAKRSKGPIPIVGTINQQPYQQTLLKYKGIWRLYINISMLPKSPQRIGELLEITIAVDPRDRTVPIHPAFEEMLQQDTIAFASYTQQSPSLKKEINRYLHTAKKKETLVKNIALAMGFLKGENRFIGRDPIKRN